MICNDKTAGRSWKRLTGLSLSLSLPYNLYRPPKHTHFTPTPRCLLGLYRHILHHETQILHSPFIVCPAITPLSLCWWKVDGVRSVRRGKREECLPAWFGNVVFSFPAVSGQRTTSASLSLQPSLPPDCFVIHGPLVRSCSVTHTVSDSQERQDFFLLLFQ